MRAWRKSSKLEPAASPAAPRLQASAVTPQPQGGVAEAVDSAWDHAQSCSDGQDGRLSLRDHCATGYAVELRRMGATAAISACQLLDAIPVAAPACRSLRGTAGTSACRRCHRSAAAKEFWGCCCGAG